MPSSAQDSLLTQVEKLAQRSHPRDVFVPIEDDASFLVLANELSTLASGRDGGDLVLLLDSRTAAEVSTMKAACEAARDVILLGEGPPAWSKKVKQVSCYPLSEALGASSRFLIIVSPELSFALVAFSVVDDDGEKLRGGWTGLRPLVTEVAQLLLDSNEPSPTFQLPEADAAEALDAGTSSSFLLMSAVARLHASRERDIDKDRDDLSSVLDILKAISARRRTHDILYVFVEKIASMVHVDRCSIVRVWGEENKGHVLASHEDASVRDIEIDLSKYPEIPLCMKSRKKVLVNNVEWDPLVRPFRKELAAAGIKAFLVIPIIMLDQEVGSFFLRAVRRSGKFAEREVSFCEIVAEAAANALERAQLFDEIQRANERLELQATTDGLTGLFNYRSFREQLDSEFARAIRYGHPLTCLMIDIDDFKKVNDTYGHLAGDSILRDVAGRSLQAVRKSDIVARYGGEEFVVIMPQTDLAGAQVHARRLLKQVSGSAYKGLPRNERITVSIGIASLDKELTPDYEALIQHADEALYQAKDQGKNRAVLWTEGTG